MKNIWSYTFSLCITLATGMPVHAHPSIGIVADNKGNIYYTDLEQVWKISDGKKTIAVPNVHTHELFLDSNETLIGEHLWYAGDATKKFYHYLWRLNGKEGKEIIVPESQAYLQVDFSLARDRAGNQYYCRFDDSMHLFKRGSLNKEERILAADLRGVKFFLPQLRDGIFFTKQNTLYAVSSNGELRAVAKNIGSTSEAMLWGVWQDLEENVYVSVFNERLIKRIDKKGEVSDFYRSESGWAPAHGVFDKNNQLWILEWSGDNEVRVKMIGGSAGSKNTRNVLLPVSVGLTVILALIIGFKQWQKNMV